MAEPSPVKPGASQWLAWCREGRQDSRYSDSVWAWREGHGAEGWGETVGPVLTLLSSFLSSRPWAFCLPCFPSVTVSACLFCNLSPCCFLSCL